MKLYRFIIIFFCINLYSQQYTSRWYGMDDGLPQNSIKDIIKDRYGFIWLSTDSGILRYDGNGFLLYNKLKTNTISFGDFLGIKNGDIICFNNNDENCVLIANRTVTVLPDGKVAKTYAMSHGKQFKRYYKNGLTGVFFPETNCYYIKNYSETYFFDNYDIIYKDGSGNEKKILKDFRFTRLKNSFEHDNIIYLPDQKNRKTLILKNGTVFYDNNPSLYNDPLSKIYWHQGTKQVFVINNGNIYISKYSNGKPILTFLVQYKNIEKELLSSMFYDEESNKLYLGNLVKGLNVINLSHFYIPQKNIPFSPEVVYEALPFSQNSLITKQGFEYRKNNVNRVFSAKANYDKRYLLYDSSHNIIYIDFNKIHRRFHSSGYQKHDSIRFFGRNVEGIFKVNGRFAVNMADSDYKYYYLYIFANDHLKQVKNIFRFKEYITFIKEFGPDLLYVGTTNGIYLISLPEKKIIKHFGKDLPVKQIQRMADGNFWVTTNNRGLYLIKNNNLLRMPEDKNGYLADAHHILEDKSGFFWISSNNGLFKVAKKAVLKYAQHQNTKVPYYRFTKEDGLLNNEFNGRSNPSGNILKNGDFVFPSLEGFVFFKPSEINTHYPSKKQLFIERAKVGEDIIPFKDTLRLKSDYQTADIFLDFPYYHKTENIYAEAQLDDGKPSQWQSIKETRRFTLNKLSPGDYILNIRFLISENGTFSYKKICIEIKPFFYQTLLFKILLVLLALAIFIGLIYVRTNYLISINRKLKDHLDNKDQELEITATQLKNESEYQQKIMESISHDITTPVRFIASISKQLDEVQDAETQKQYVDEIHKTSEQLFKFTLDLKEYTKLFKEIHIFDEKEYFLHPLIENKKLLFEPIAKNANVKIMNLCDPAIQLNVNKNILSAIFHNVIDNAVKNTKEGTIQIKTEMYEDVIEISVHDTGQGMSKSQIMYYSEVFNTMEKQTFAFKNYGLGLHMVIQMVKKLNAKISFHENIPHGTVVKIIIKHKSYE